MQIRSFVGYLVIVFVGCGAMSIGRAASHAKDIGEATTYDIKSTLKSAYLDLLSSSDLASWDDVKNRIDAVKKATESFELKYSNELKGGNNSPVATQMPENPSSVSETMLASDIKTTTPMASDVGLSAMPVSAPEKTVASVTPPVEALAPVSTPEVAAAINQPVTGAMDSMAMTPTQMATPDVMATTTAPEKIPTISMATAPAQEPATTPLIAVPTIPEVMANPVEAVAQSPMSTQTQEMATAPLASETAPPVVPVVPAPGAMGAPAATVELPSAPAQTQDMTPALAAPAPSVPTIPEIPLAPVSTMPMA